jgi:hypothetical protein
MKSRERVCLALRFENPDRAPRYLSIIPAVGMFLPHEIQRILEHFPSDIVLPIDTNGTAVQVSGKTIVTEQEVANMFHYGASP